MAEPRHAGHDDEPEPAPGPVPVEQGRPPVAPPPPVAPLSSWPDPLRVAPVLSCVGCLAADGAAGPVETVVEGTGLCARHGVEAWLTQRRPGGPPARGLR